jgi:hypothetical protein
VAVEEGKVDAAEMKVDAAEMKVDAAEMKVDAAEMKVDAAEMKVDVAEMKVGGDSGAVVAVVTMGKPPTWKTPTTFLISLEPLQLLQLSSSHPLRREEGVGVL